MVTSSEAAARTVRLDADDLKRRLEARQAITILDVRVRPVSSSRTMCRPADQVVQASHRSTPRPVETARETGPSGAGTRVAYVQTPGAS